jgi:hypothetical protein
MIIQPFSPQIQMIKRPTPYQYEICRNRGMEEGDPPNEWVILGTPSTFERSSAQKHSGSYAAHVISGTGTFSGMQQQVAKVAGLKYQLTFWYYLVSGGLYAYLTSGDNAQVLTGVAYTDLNAWKLASQTGVEIITGALGHMWFFQQDSGVSSEFYIDDVSLKRIPL